MNIYLVVILAILIVDYILDIAADTLNVKRIRTELPAEFKGYYDPEKYRRSQQYLKENTRFATVADSILTPVTIAFILLGGFNLVDRFARSFNWGPVATGLVFAGALTLISQAIRIPFSAYRTFIIEERYGFNKTTVKTFITDILKKWLLGAVIGGALFAVVLWLFREAGAWAWLWCWGIITVCIVFFTFIAPVVIMPLFNKFVPLEDGALKEAIERYAESQRFKLAGVFTMDASRRTAKTNAFFTGFGRFRRIALFDTLIQKHSVDELVSVLAHEIGHYKKKHVIVSLMISIGTTGLMLFILSLFINNGELFRAFGMEHLSVYASIFFFAFLFAPIQMIVSIFSNMLSRKHEYRADEFAARTYGRPESMITALKKLAVDNLSNLTPHPLKVFLSYSHPPVLQRIYALQKFGESVDSGSAHSRKG